MGFLRDAHLHSFATKGNEQLEGDPFGIATCQVLVAICLGWFTPENEGPEIEIDACKSRLLAGWGSFFLFSFTS